MVSLEIMIDVILHVDKYLNIIIQSYHLWVYAILFLIIFLETGLVLTPFLPGDSLLFTAGSFAGLGILNIGWLFGLLTVAAIAGDSINYLIGYYLGPKVFKSNNSYLFNKDYLERTKEFYAKHGKKAVVLGRFAPIIRTFVPFVAGIGKMSYKDFIRFNVLGAILWTGTLLFAGFFFGTIPIVQNNFSIVLYIIIFLSFIPMIIEIIKARKTTSSK